MQFTALLGGKIVTYPATATFRIDKKVPGHKWEPHTTRPSISAALSIFHNVEDRGMKAKLVAVHGKTTKTLYRTGK